MPYSIPSPFIPQFMLTPSVLYWVGFLSKVKIRDKSLRCKVKWSGGKFTSYGWLLTFSTKLLKVLGLYLNASMSSCGGVLFPQERLRLNTFNSHSIALFTRTHLHYNFTPRTNPNRRTWFVVLRKFSGFFVIFIKFKSAVTTKLAKNSASSVHVVKFGSVQLRFLS